jgi:hypothetical protein
MLEVRENWILVEETDENLFVPEWTAGSQLGRSYSVDV